MSECGAKYPVVSVLVRGNADSKRAEPIPGFNYLRGIFNPQNPLKRAELTHWLLWL